MGFRFIHYFHSRNIRKKRGIISDFFIDLSHSALTKDEIGDSFSKVLRSLANKTRILENY